MTGYDWCIFVLAVLSTINSVLFTLHLKRWHGAHIDGRADG